MKESDRVVLVDEQDRPIGTEEKLRAHKEGVLHRAFSVLVFNSAGQMLLQQRSPEKYHSGGLWSNTCCSHPRPGEPVEAAARRRLEEEMGFTCDVETVFNFTYRVQLGALWEHELDHVLVGYYDGDPAPDADEVGSWKWVDMEDLKIDMEAHPERYTYWFRMLMKHLTDSSIGDEQP